MAKKNNNTIIWIGGSILIIYWLFKSGKLNKLLPSGGGATSGSAANTAKMAVNDVIQSKTFAPEETSFKAMYEADINKCN
jgi:hypothetical protein